MGSPGHGTARWLRAALLVAMTALVSLGGHALAGGSVHLSAPMLLGVLVLGAMCVAAADVRRTFPEILAVVVLAQAPLHLLASMGGHEGHAGTAALTQAVDAGITTGMVAAHLGAALVVSLLLADAERVLWALDGLRLRIRLPRPVTTPVLSLVVSPVVPAVDGRLRPALRAAPRHRRGPPLVVAAA